MDKHYTVSQATEMTGVKAYVLRYWEDEMELRIGRNTMGHRYYTAYDIQLFLNIKELKNRGLQLRAIKELIPKIAQTAPGSTKSKVKLLGDGRILRRKRLFLRGRRSGKQPLQKKKIIKFWNFSRSWSA